MVRYYGRNIIEYTQRLTDGYTVEVDLEYPKEIHEAHADFPLCPTNMAIDPKELSDYQRDLYIKLHDVDEEISKDKIKTGSKLMGTLFDKEKYIMSYHYLKECVAGGMKIKRIHRCVEYKQSKWLEPYISKNTALRKLASQLGDDFGCEIFKFLNNSIFGKTMENVRNRIDFRLVTDDEALQKLINKPNYSRRVTFGDEYDEDYAGELCFGVHLLKNSVSLNKPIYVGAAILDISKRDMTEFHYGFMKEKYGNNAQVCYTDTDSLIYEVKTDDLYKRYGET
jgi:hypothetical protein